MTERKRLGAARLAGGIFACLVTPSAVLTLFAEIMAPAHQRWSIASMDDLGKLGLWLAFTTVFGLVVTLPALGVWWGLHAMKLTSAWVFLAVGTLIGLVASLVLIPGEPNRLLLLGLSGAVSGIMVWIAAYAGAERSSD